MHSNLFASNSSKVRKDLVAYLRKIMNSYGVDFGTMDKQRKAQKDSLRAANELKIKDFDVIYLI